MDYFGQGPIPHLGGYSLGLGLRLGLGLGLVHKLTRNSIEWKWKEKEKAFQTVKDMLCTDMVLAHFDPSLPIGISCDAFNVGIGAVLFHRFQDGQEPPIANASKTLTERQRKYSQIQKEALAVVFALRKFHQWTKIS